LDLVITSDKSTWPELFNGVFPLHTRIPESDRIYFRGAQSFFNRPGDTSPYLIRGFTEQCQDLAGIPGWRRICFIIYNTNTESLSINLDNDPGVLNQVWTPWGWWTDFLWAYGYDGIIIPGGKIMMGRWLDVLRQGEKGATGPFIFWEV
jgi:hypothetical protein